jgi:hypothetical protein
MFSSSSQMSFPRVFPKAPRFNPICFAQSPPLLTYIGEPKGGGTPSFLRIFLFWGASIVPNQIGLCEKKNVELERDPD